MRDFATRHPLLYGTALFFACLLASVPLMLLLQRAGLTQEVASAVARLVMGTLVLVLARHDIAWDRSFSGLALALPALGFVAWNLVFNTTGGMQLVSPDALPAALVCGLAPAVFEEAVFRGVVIGRMRAGGRGTWQTLLGSALLFAVVHLTNAVGADLVNTLVQTAYALVVGLLFGAMYLRSGDIVTVIAAHAAVDISSKIFAAHPSQPGTPWIVAFVVLMAVEVAIALRMAQGLDQDAKE